MARGSMIVLGAGTVLHRRGKMLVVERARQPHLGLWAFPGGRVEPGESPLQAALRETREEVGLEAKVERIFDVVTYFPGKPSPGARSRPPRDQVVIVDYLARPEPGRVVLNGESSDFRWVLPSELVRLRTTPQMKACARRFAELGVY